MVKRPRRRRATGAKASGERPHRIFILSPAHCGGERAQLVFNEGAQFPLARRLRSREGAPLGEVFTFLSGLYFRGKLAYAQAFAAPPPGVPGVAVITTNEGLLDPGQRVGLDRLRSMGRGDIDLRDASYRRPLLRDATLLAAAAGADCEVVLLGSVATGKYVDLLLEVFGPALRFPADFAGRGDMSRGGLLLRCVDAGRELEYVRLDGGAPRHGPRPPRLAPRA
jgi:hypothetical protein